MSRITMLLKSVTLALLATVTFGCGGSGSSTPSGGKSTQINSPTGLSIEVDESGVGTITQAGVEGEIQFGSEVASAELPDGFPAALAYPGGKVEVAQWSKDSGMVVFVTTDSVEKVAAHYNGKLAEGEWTLRENPLAAALANSGMHQLIAASGTQNCLATIGGETSGKNKGKTQVSIQILPK